MTQTSYIPVSVSKSQPAPTLIMFVVTFLASEGGRELLSCRYKNAGATVSIAGRFDCKTSLVAVPCHAHCFGQQCGVGLVDN
jgi:hypothetical protein